MRTDDDAPCHRVVGAGGKLTGYAGGTDKKQWLLTWERRATREDPGRSQATRE
jgi:hypothetical protein